MRVRYVEQFQRASLRAAADGGFDGVVCGHIHKADLVERDGLVYCNDGDWVESCTALVEDLQGELRLLSWRPAAADRRRCSAVARRRVIFGPRVRPSPRCILPISAQPRVNRAPMAKPGNTGFRRIVNATFYSFAGLRTAWRTEAAFRQECVAVVVLIPVAVWLGQSAVQRALLVGSCVLVLIVELLNTAIELVVDRVGTDHHELSGRAKDVGLRRGVHEHRARDAGLGVDRLGALRSRLARRSVRARSASVRLPIASAPPSSAPAATSVG